MKKEKIITKKTIAAAFASSVLATTLVASEAMAKHHTERCADIVKGGKNGCAIKRLGTSCHGHASEDNTVGAWIKVPTGTCNEIVAICTDKAKPPKGVEAKAIEKACAKVAAQTDPEIMGGRLVDKYGESLGKKY